VVVARPAGVGQKRTVAKLKEARGNVSKIRGAIIAIGLLALGSFAGYRVATESSASIYQAQRVLTLSSASTEVGNAYASANKVAYETSLWRYLALLEAQAADPAADHEDWVIATDKALTYARLADVASEQGLAEKSRYLLREAVKECPRMHLKECSQTGILQLARRSIEGVATKPATRGKIGSNE
jgi:hypothetical protein